MNGSEISYSLDDVCVLIAESETRGEHGEAIVTRSEWEVYCRRRNINQSEFFKAHQEGLRSDICLLLNFEDYSGEKIVEYDGKEYAVYRVYERGDGFAELYMSERAGVSDGL